MLIPQEKLKALAGNLLLLLIAVGMLAAGAGALWGHGQSPELGITFAYAFTLPTLLAAFFYGPILGLCAALLSGLVSGGLVINSLDMLSTSIERQVVFQIIFFGIIALATAALAGRERKEHARCHDLFLNAPLGLYRCTPTGRYLEANPALLQILGYADREALLATNAAALYARPEDYEARRQALDTYGELRHFETQMRCSDQSLVWVQEDSRAERDARGQVIYYWGSLQDISARKRAEGEAGLLNAKLEDRAAQCMLQLKATNRELEDLSYAISHDLRAPLRGISGFSQALIEDYSQQLDETGHKYLEYIRSAGLHMNQLIDDLLRLARLSRTEMQRSEIDLSEIANDIAAKLQISQPEREAVFVIAPRLKAKGDGYLIYDVLANLLENAWKFTARRAMARIEFGALYKDQQTVYYVRDNGVGFDSAAAQRIFAAFQRQHAQDEFPGTGIGLALVQRVIHRHGGLVWAEGAMDEGATFYFTLGEEENREFIPGEVRQPQDYL